MHEEGLAVALFWTCADHKNIRHHEKGTLSESGDTHGLLPMQQTSPRLDWANRGYLGILFSEFLFSELTKGSRCFGYLLEGKIPMRKGHGLFLGP